MKRSPFAALIDACRTLIDSAPTGEQEELASATANLGTLRFNKALLSKLLRSRTMLEIPFMTEFAEQAEARGKAEGACEAGRKAALWILRRRFGEPSPGLAWWRSSTPSTTPRHSRRCRIWR